MAVDPDRLVFETAANEHWLIAMDGHTNTSGTSVMYLRWTPPPTNDTWTGRIVLPSTAVTVGGRTFAATADAADREALGLPTGTLRTVWWEWRAPSVGRWAVPNLASSADVNFAVFRGDKIKATNRVTPGPEPVFCFDAAEGETFGVMAFSTTGFGGNVAFALRPVQAPVVRLARKRGEGGNLKTLLETAENAGLPYEIQISSDLVYWRHFTSVQSPYAGLFESDDFRYLGQAFFRTQLVTPDP